MYVDLDTNFLMVTLAAPYWCSLIENLWLLISYLKVHWSVGQAAGDGREQVNYISDGCCDSSMHMFLHVFYRVLMV